MIPSGILRLQSARGSSQQVLKVVTYAALISDSLPWRKWTQDIHLPCFPAVQSLNPVLCDAHVVCSPSFSVVVLHCYTQTVNDPLNGS